MSHSLNYFASQLESDPNYHDDHGIEIKDILIVSQQQYKRQTYRAF